MVSVIRFFKYKKLHLIFKIAKQIKTDFDLFKYRIPSLISLRTDCMKDRRWDMLNKKKRMEIKPYEGFNFKKSIDMNFVNHTDKVVDV